MQLDQKTAEAFASSWNNLPQGSVYSFEQFKEWLEPLNVSDFEGKNILELGCGNASLLAHTPQYNPQTITGVDLGESVKSAEANMNATGFSNWRIIKSDLTTFESDGYDLVYCIGVLHHLKKPLEGFESVLRNTKPGGKFHCWVYAREGNNVVVYFVDPLRKIVSRLPWWFTKYLVATPLTVPFYLYANFLNFFSRFSVFKVFPLFDYSLWISKRDFLFFRHVAFDQLVTPQTIYLNKETLVQWMASHSEVEPNSTYLIFRNGNSWKFGGKKRI